MPANEEQRMMPVWRRPFTKLGVVFITITGGGTLVWTVFLLWFLNAPQDKINTILTGIVPIGLISGLLILAYVKSLLNSIIKVFLEASKRVASRDLTTVIDFATKDVFGKMAGCFNEMVTDVHGTVNQNLETAHKVADEAKKVSLATEAATSSIEQISVAIEQIAGGSMKQAEQIMSTLQTMQELNAGVQQIAANSQIAFDFSKEAAGSAQKGAAEVGRAVQKMQAIAEVVQNSERAVQKLNERSEQIGEIVNVITSIADQTNLLALNAAIEAARAGEHGRGFAVVADEVRKLAEGSGTAAQQIGELIKEIQDDTSLATQSMAKGSKEVVEGTAIASVAKQALNEIVKAVGQVEQMIEGISSAASQQSVGIGQVVEAVESVSNISQQSSVATQQVSASVQQQMSSNEQISLLASNLAELADELKSIIGRFKLN